MNKKNYSCHVVITLIFVVLGLACTINAAPNQTQPQQPMTREQKENRIRELEKQKAQQSQPQQQTSVVKGKPKVAVYVTGGKTPAENQALSARITHGLVNSGRYSTIERADAFLDQVTKEMTTQRSGSIDDRQISKLGQQAGAKFVCVGEILEVFGAHQISARIIDVESVEVIASGLASGQLRTMAEFATLSDHVVSSLLGIISNTGTDTRVSASAAPVTPSMPSAAQNTPAPPIDLSKNQPSIVVDGVNLTEKLQWLRTNAVSNTGYLIELNGNERIGQQSISFQEKSGVKVWIRGTDGERIISLSGNGALFTVGAGVTLILDGSATLWGHTSNNSALVVVMSEGEFIMNAGAKISSNNGRGVWVRKSANFTMIGGEISGNRGGVFVDTSAAFTMKGGEISGNNVSGGGAGVYVNISGNFTMDDGKISGNVVGGDHRNGGGVFLNSSANFTMRNGEISGNRVGGNNVFSDRYRNIVGGGGVYLHEAATFKMEGGKISDNRAGAARYMNHCYVYGGGVYVNNGIFTKTGGIILGNTQGDDSSNRTWCPPYFSNEIGLGSGHAVYISGGKSRNTTAGPRVNLDSRKAGAAGGWEDGSTSSVGSSGTVPPPPPRSTPPPPPRPPNRRR